LRPFFERAINGQIATGVEIKMKLEEHLGRKIHKTTVYRILKRHGWRKIAPRPVHVQAKPEKQEEFKKTSPKQ
jgi:transposase